MISYRVCGSIRIGFWTWVWSTRHYGLRQEWLVDFNAGKTQQVSFDQLNNTGAIDVKMDGSVVEEKSSFEMLGFSFSSKLYWGSYIISTAKTISKKIGALSRSMKFLSPEFVLYFYKSIMQPCTEYCCHVYTGVFASLEHLAYRRNVASLSLFYM